MMMTMGKKIHQTKENLFTDKNTSQTEPKLQKRDRDFGNKRLDKHTDGTHIKSNQKPQIFERPSERNK